VKVSLAISLWHAHVNGGVVFTRNFVDMGVAGFWNDMNEPSVFLTAAKTMPLDVRHRMDDGTTLPHLRFTMYLEWRMSRATEEVC